MLYGKPLAGSGESLEKASCSIVPSSLYWVRHYMEKSGSLLVNWVAAIFWERRIGKERNRSILEENNDQGN